MDRRPPFYLLRIGLLLAGLAAAGLWFAVLPWGERFATDVSVLLPESKTGTPAADLLAEVREAEERLILGAIRPPAAGWGGGRDAVTTVILEHLQASGRFARIAEGAGPSAPDALAEAVYSGRFDLLLPQWAEAAGVPLTDKNPDRWAEAIIQSLESFLFRTEASALADLIPEDPFPLAGYMADTGPVVTETDQDGPILFWAIQKDSPFLPSGQEPVLSALEAAVNAASEVLPGISAQHTSVAAFAAESERRIRSEITTLNFFAVLLVGLVAFFCLRRRLMLLHLMAIAALAVTGGLVSVLLFFPVVHVLSLVVGGLLVGVAVDYGIHILLHRPGVPGSGFSGTLCEVRKPLLASALSTAAGFAALAFADLLLIRQIGVFVAGGLASALIASWIYFPLWPLPKEIARVDNPFAALKGFFGSTSRTRTPRNIVILAVLILPLAGWLRLDWRDDVRDLQPPLVERLREDSAVRLHFSQESDHTAWLCPGSTPREARALLEAFTESWESSGGDRNDLASLAPWVAAPAERDAVRATFSGMPDFQPVMRQHFGEEGFDADQFEPFFDALDEWLSGTHPSYEYRLEAVAAALDGPAGMLLRQGRSGWWFSVSTPSSRIPDGWVAPPGVVEAAQLESLNELFGEYRRAAWRISGVAGAVIIGGVLILFGPKAGAASLLLPAFAWVWGIGAVAGMASPLNLFHLLGGFLGFCVALDYGLFFRHARALGRGLPISIRISAATTLSAFGVLAFGTIPAVAALGLSVFAVVLGGWIVVETTAGFRSKRRAS
jgi:predicted exporter